MKCKKLQYKNIYTVKELNDVVPFGASDNYHIKILKYGYLHDTGIIIELTPVQNGEKPQGWNTLNQDLNEMLQHVKACWDMAIDYGYHGV